MWAVLSALYPAKTHKNKVFSYKKYRGVGNHVIITDQSYLLIYLVGWIISLNDVVWADHRPKNKYQTGGVASAGGPFSPFVLIT